MPPIAFRQRAIILRGALLERLLRLLGCRFTADRQPPPLAAATTAAVFADVVETAQLATFVSGVVAMT